MRDSFGQKSFLSWIGIVFLSWIVLSLNPQTSTTTTTRRRTSVFVRGESGSISSTSSSRVVPTGLSTVLKKLQASDGTSRVVTAAFLSSKSVLQSERIGLIRSLFAIGVDAADDTSLESATAFSKDGIAVACPPVDASAVDAAATVLACSGNVVYVADGTDLLRGECLWDHLAPSIERLLATQMSDSAAAAAAAVKDEDSTDKSAKSALVVVMKDATTKEALDDLKSKFEAQASAMLASLALPISSKSKPSALSDVFDIIAFTSPHMLNNDGISIDSLLTDCSLDITNAKSAVSAVAKADWLSSSASSSYSPSSSSSSRDLAAAWMVSPAARNAIDKALTKVRDLTTDTDSGSIKLIPNFGQLCDAAVQDALTSLSSSSSSSQDNNNSAASSLVKSTSLGKQLLSHLQERLYAEFSILYNEQLTILRTTSLDAFKKSLSSLRLTANLPNDMERVASKSVSSFATAAHKLAHCSKNSSWRSPTSEISDYRRILSEYITQRLQAAKASGKIRPIPRKGITVGLHWLLPKPFGNDYRQEPWKVHARDNLMYVPSDKTNVLTDVEKKDVLTGDWRKGLVPSPKGKEMVYSPQ